MPNVSWEWKLTPQIIVSLANLAIMGIGVIGLFYKMQTDIATQREMTIETKAAVEIMRQAQSTAVERLTKVETKVDMILPTLQRIDMNIRQAPR